VADGLAVDELETVAVEAGDVRGEEV